MDSFNGLGLHPGNLARLSPAQSRPITPENFTGAAGAGDLPSMPDSDALEVI